MTDQALVVDVERKECMERVGDQFSFFGTVSLVFGVIYSYCLYRNPYGIAFPLFIVMGYGLALLILRKMNVEIKRDSYFLIGLSILIGVATCRTTSGFLVTFNRVSLILLNLVFWIHQFYQDRVWNIGKYTGAIAEFLFQIISAVLIPFRHLNRYLSSIKDEKCKKLVLVLKGVALAIPLMIVVGVLLSMADLVFRDILISLASSFFNVEMLVAVISRILVGSVLGYCLICAVSGKGISEEQRDLSVKEPVVAITVMSLVGIVYLLFCGIQIVYLFMGKGTLPVGVTYAAYARQGFFQLMFVAVLNLVLVLSCIKYFKHSKWLNFVLTEICFCTCVMIASAAYRMLLYIGEYHLTLLRILVLWLLAILSIFMIGIVTIIYRNKFPLFRYCLVVVSTGYLLLAWMRPDFIIAEYNVGQNFSMTERHLEYLTGLSSDAAPALKKLNADAFTPEMNMNLENYFVYYEKLEQEMTWKTYNFSLARISRY